MRKQRRTGEYLVRQLQAMTERKFGLTLTAQELGFTPQFILDVVKGRRLVSTRLAAAMGYERVVVFEKVI